MPILNDVHILKVGGSTSADGVDKFHTRADLVELAASYDPSVHEAPVVLGHDSDTKWEELLSSDVHPSFGWIKEMYVKGNDLFAKVDASDELVEFIEKKRYKKRSLAYYGKTSKHNPTKGRTYVRHLAMLGSSPPAIKGLNDIKLAEEEKMTTPEQAKELLNAQAADWLAFVLKDNGNVFNETIVAFEPAPSEENNWLYNSEEQKFEGALVTDTDEQFLFEVNFKGNDAEDVIVSIKSTESNEPLSDDTELTEEEPMVEETKMTEEVATELSEETKELSEEGTTELSEEDKELAEGGKCPECEKKNELGEKFKLQEEEKKKMMEENKALKEELELLREKVRLQEEREMAEKVEEAVKYSEAVYTSGKLLESQLPQEELTALMTNLVSMNQEHMVYGEEDNQKDVLTVVKQLLDALPEQVKLSETVSKSFVTQPKSDPNYTDDSMKLDSAIRSAMKEHGYKQDDMIQYRRFYRELNGRV